MFNFKLIKNSQRGSIQLSSMLLCLSFLSILTLVTMSRYKQWFSLKKNLHQITCVKKFHHETRQVVNFVHRINQIILAKNIIQLAGLFFPQTWVAQTTLVKIKKALKATQLVRVGLHYKRITQLFLDKCRISLRALQTPFKLKGLNLDRDYRGLTQIRNKENKLCHILSYQVICSNLKFKSSLNTDLDIESSATYLPRVL